MSCEICGKPVGTIAPLCWRCDLRVFSIRVAMAQPVPFKPCHGGCGRGAREGSFHCGETNCARIVREQHEVRS